MVSMEGSKIQPRQDDFSSTIDIITPAEDLRYLEGLTNHTLLTELDKPSQDQGCPNGVAMKNSMSSSRGCCSQIPKARPCSKGGAEKDATELKAFIDPLTELYSVLKTDERKLPQFTVLFIVR